RFVQTTDVGYAREHVIVMDMPHWSLNSLAPTIRDAWKRDASVLAVTEMTGLPTSVGARGSYSRWEGGPEDAAPIGIYQSWVSYDALDVFGIDLVAGRSFDHAFATDTSGAALVNETAVRAMGWTPEEALGRWFGFEERRIIGVMRDFHFHSLHLPIEPLMFRLDLEELGTVAARVQPSDLGATFGRLEAAAASLTEYPIEVRFLDAEFDALYRADRRLGQTFGFFTVVALLIASLGLFGLAAFAAEQRTKEIGIRKVLGADVLGLVRMLSLDFVKLVAVAFVVAAPIGYVVMQRWLADFAYRIDLGPGLFVVAGGGALVIAVAAVSVQALRAATADPVRSLRYE
ncbi:MAG: FtsX-like permease family protein, partial [Bacteroidota bacterium]